MIGAIILSRTSSSRLANKAILSLGKSSLVEQIISQLKDIKGVVPILTTSNREDDKILTDIAKKNKISYFCGDLDNVSKRVHDCVKHFNFTSFFRVNGDSPIIDKALLRKALTLIHDFDFVTNLSPRSYPYGVSVELIKSDTFFKYQKKFNKDQQEHITKFFYENNEFIKTINLISDIGYKPDTVLTIDDMNSYQTFWKLFSEHPNVLDLSVKEIITLINKNK